MKRATLVTVIGVPVTLMAIATFIVQRSSGAGFHLPEPCSLLAEVPFIGLDERYLEVLHGHLRSTHGWLPEDYCITGAFESGFGPSDIRPGERPPNIDSYIESLNARVVILVAKGGQYFPDDPYKPEEFVVVIDPVTLKVVPDRIELLH